MSVDIERALSGREVRKRSWRSGYYSDISENREDLSPIFVSAYSMLKPEQYFHTIFERKIHSFLWILKIDADMKSS